MASSHIIMAASHIIMAASHIIMASSHIIMAATHIIMTSSHIIMAATHIIMAASHIIMASSHIIMAASHIIMARTHIIMASSHIIMAATHVFMAESDINGVGRHNRSFDVQLKLLKNSRVYFAGVSTFCRLSLKNTAISSFITPAGAGLQPVPFICILFFLRHGLHQRQRGLFHATKGAKAILLYIIRSPRNLSYVA